MFTDQASLVTQTVKNLPTMQETYVQSLGWGDPLEEGMVTDSSIFAWRIPMDGGAWQVAIHEVTESDMTEQLSKLTDQLIQFESPRRSSL